MANSFIMGFNGYLYLGEDPLNGDTVEPWTAAQWGTPAGDNEMAFIGDVNIGGSPTEVDTTTRQTARTGFTSSVEVLQSGEITWTVQKRTITEPLMRKLIVAKKNHSDLALMALSETLTTDGSWGYAGNYTINFSDGQPVAGVQTLDITAKLASYSYLLEVFGGVVQLLEDTQPTP